MHQPLPRIEEDSGSPSSLRSIFGIFTLSRKRCKCCYVLCVRVYTVLVWMQKLSTQFWQKKQKKQKKKKRSSYRKKIGVYKGFEQFGFWGNCRSVSFPMKTFHLQPCRTEQHKNLPRFYHFNETENKPITFLKRESISFLWHLQHCLHHFYPFVMRSPTEFRSIVCSCKPQVYWLFKPLTQSVAVFEISNDIDAFS